MKKCAKLFCLILAALMLAGAIASCGKGEQTTPSGENTASTGSKASDTQPSGEASTAASETPATADPSVPTNEAVLIDSLKLSKSGLTLKVGTYEQLEFIVTPANADTSVLVWTVQDPTVATVENGKVTAVKVGTTTVILKTQDGVMKASCTVNVTEGDARTVPVEELRLSKTVVVLKEGEETVIGCTVLPDDATDKTVQYVSDSAAVASVDQAGRITAAGAGLTRIRATSGAVIAECLLIVRKSDGTLPAILTATKTVQIGKTTELTYDTSLFEGAGELTLVSSDSGVVSVSGSTATAVSVGKATVSVKDGAGNELYAFNVNVTEEPTNLPITGIRLSKEKVTVKVGEKVTITASLLPEGAVETRIEWINECKTKSGIERGYEGIYELTGSGEIKGLKAGTAPVTAYCKDPTTGKEFTAVCWVQVTGSGTDVPPDDDVKPVGISVSQDSFTVKVGDTFTIEYYLVPANATAKVDYIIEPDSTGARDYVSIDRETGVITALKPSTGGKVRVWVADGVNKGVKVTITEG